MKILMAEHTHFDSTFQVGCHHLSRELVRRGHQVTYISSCITPFHAAQALTHRRSEAVRRFRNWSAGGVRQDDQLETYVPMGLLPFTRFPGLDNEQVARKYVEWTLPSLSRWLRERGPFDLFLIGEPRFVPLIDSVSAKAVFLRLTDNVLEFPSTPKTVSKLLARAGAECDRVIVTSRPLVEMMENDYGANDVAYVPNGVDMSRFLTAEVSEPLDLKSIPGPRAIYVGAMERWFDTDLVAHAAERAPHVSFVLIGTVSGTVSSLKKFSNVHLLGPKPSAQIAGYLSHCDVGIIPFKRTPLVEAVSPVKLFEYMACGLPVVSTSWDELRRMGSPALLAEQPEEFVSRIVEVTRRRSNRQAFIDFAKANSWSQRAERIVELANEVLVPKPVAEKVRLAS